MAEDDTTHDLDERRELERLRLRVRELERELERARQVEQRLQDSELRFRRLTEITNEAVTICDNGIIVDVSQQFEEMFGHTVSSVIGKSALLMAAPESRESIALHMRTGYDKPYEGICMRKDGTRFSALFRGKAIQFQGRPMRVTAILDISERKQIEEARRAGAVHEELIRAQAEMLTELSTPLLPISESILVLPLIGEVNAERARQVVEALARGVFEHRASIAILDITGMPAVGRDAADMLASATHTARMLGSRIVLTGVRPDVARTFVEMGADLGDTVTCGTLQQGVAYAFRTRGV